MAEYSHVVPPPEIGDVVLWYQEGDPDSPPFAAHVTAIGLDSLTLNIMDPSVRNYSIKDGVRHISDPYCRRAETKDAGGWEYRPKDLALLKLVKEFTK